MAALQQKGEGQPTFISTRPCVEFAGRYASLGIDAAIAEADTADIVQEQRHWKVALGGWEDAAAKL